jgi:hypothetical protein
MFRWRSSPCPTGRLGGYMNCPLCANLESAFEARRREYIGASSVSFFKVSRKFAAYFNVEMERAWIDLEEHRAVCLRAGNKPAYSPSALLPRPVRREEPRIEAGDSAA